MNGKFLTIWCGIMISISWMGCARSSAWTVRPQGRMNHSEIVESSGVAASRRFEDVLWTHNDSNNPPQLFAVDKDGKLIRSYQIPEAQNNDWEDLALDAEGNLFVLDNTSRTDPQNRNFVYIFHEPNPFEETQIAFVRKIPVRFPDGGFDCETIFVWDETIYLVTKPWDGGLPRIYRFEDLEDGGTAVFVGQVPVYAMITGGDISSDGTRIVLSSYRALLVFQGSDPPSTKLQSDPLVCPLNARQVEGVTWSEDELVLTNEQRDIFRVPRSKWENHRAPFLRSRKESVPNVKNRPSVADGLKSWPAGSWLSLKLDSKSVNIGRLAWSTKGLHIGIDLPKGIRLRTMQAQSPPSHTDWFRPGSVYLMINPDGDRPLAYGKDDRCIVLGRTPEGVAMAEVRYLRPATLIASSETMPEWIEIEEHGRRLLLTLTPATPGVKEFIPHKTLGFNLLLIRDDGEMISWTALNQRYSWDMPSVWGLLELSD